MGAAPARGNALLTCRVKNRPPALLKESSSGVVIAKAAGGREPEGGHQSPTRRAAHHFRRRTARAATAAPAATDTNVNSFGAGADASAATAPRSEFNPIGKPVPPGKHGVRKVKAVRPPAKVLCDGICTLIPHIERAAAHLLRRAGPRCGNRSGLGRRHRIRSCTPHVFINGVYARLRKVKPEGKKRAWRLRQSGFPAAGRSPTDANSRRFFPVVPPAGRNRVCV
jgi:hypothetical protein